jgi:hypothetical protein
MVIATYRAAHPSRLNACNAVPAINYLAAT